ncbi:hypothetical protein C8R47DRAFT_1140685, partial [Mycena vitilis]
MKFAFSAFVALAIAVVAPINAAVVSGGAGGTAVGHTITPQDVTAPNSTAQSAPVSHNADDYFKCFGAGSQSVSVRTMRDLVQAFCNANAGEHLRSGKQGPTITVPIHLYVRLAIGPGTDCSTVIDSDTCKVEMGKILNTCQDHGGDLYYAARCLYYAVYPTAY